MTNAERWIIDSYCSCPYCGVTHDLVIDPAEGDVQEFIEDCHVCCRPINITIRYNARTKGFAIDAVSEDE